jgi:hypothetical protein
MALREGGPTATNGRRPRSGRDSDRADPEIRSRSGDPAASEITSLTASSQMAYAIAIGNGEFFFITRVTRSVCDKLFF